MAFSYFCSSCESCEHLHAQRRDLVMHSSFSVMVLASVIASVTSLAFFVLTDCVGIILSSLSQCCVRQLYARTGMYVQSVQTNVDKIPFLLERMGLYSSNILWPYEATPEGGQGIRYGFFAVRCQSMLLYACSVFHLVYYIYVDEKLKYIDCLLYTSPSPRDMRRSRMPSSA